jgi:anti-sigma B factor antagonist
MLNVNTRNLGNVAVLSLQGRIVNGETASLREAVRAQSAVSAIVLDLGRVSAIDASGLGLLLQLRNEIQSNGMRLRVMNASRFVQRIFEITRLDSVFEVSTSAERMPALVSSKPARVMPFARCA